MREDNLIYNLWLLTSLGVANPKIHDIIGTFGNCYNAFIASDESLKKINSLSSQEINTLKKYKNLERAKKVIEDCQKKKIGIITMNDPIYPDNLRNIENPPSLLFYKGKKPRINKKLCITMVGTRRLTKYGAAVSEHIAFELAGAGTCIISGLAKGIDYYAHRGALNAWGQTVAVMGCGIDYIYPYENRDLYNEIIEKGAVFSEFLPGTPPLPKNFQFRNRILSGMSEGVVVVETPKKGGSLITVKWALEQGRDIFAVPGQISALQSEGTNDLIKQGAKLVTGAYDILEEYVYKYSHKIDLNSLSAKIFFKEPEQTVTAASAITQYETKDKPSVKVKQKPIVLNSTEQTVYDVLNHNPKDITQIVEEANTAFDKTVLALTSMQIAGHVSELPGGFYVRS